MQALPHPIGHRRAQRATRPDIDAAPGDGAAPLLVPGRNCWRVERASRVAMLVDGEAYFAAFAEAARLARRRLVIIGWDFHAGVRLHPGGAGGHEDAVGAFLEGLVAARPELRVHVLDWDYSLIYALQRQLLPRLRLGRLTHPRFAFQLDACHPPAAAQHQKIVVVDDAIAFVGGMDFGPGRWDSPAHRPQDARRVDPDGRAYGPFHDVQMLVDGAAARALGALAGARWQRATGEALEPLEANGDPWPRAVLPDLRDVDVAIARTQPAHDGCAEVREVEQLYLDAIAAACRSIYIESQYLTAVSIGAALMRRLAEADGPEIVIVQPRECEGWLEQTAMGVLRARLMRRLLAADRYDRLRVYHPDVAGLGEQRLTVHAKVLVVDDRLVRVGSANLNNRSMGLDSECDLAIDAGDDAALRRRIAALRDRLLGEHLGQPPERVAAALADGGSLIAAIERLGSAGRGLRLLSTEVDAWLERAVPDQELMDPDRPMAAERILARLMPRQYERPPRRSWLRRAAAGAVVAAAAVALAIALAR